MRDGLRTYPLTWVLFSVGLPEAGMDVFEGRGLKGSLGSAGQNYESSHLVSEDLSVDGKCRSGRVLY